MRAVAVGRTWGNLVRAVAVGRTWGNLVRAVAVGRTRVFAQRHAHMRTCACSQAQAPRRWTCTGADMRVHAHILMHTHVHTQTHTTCCVASAACGDSMCVISVVVHSWPRYFVGPPPPPQPLALAPLPLGLVPLLHPPTSDVVESALCLCTWARLLSERSERGRCIGAGLE